MSDLQAELMKAVKKEMRTTAKQEVQKAARDAVEPKGEGLDDDELEALEAELTAADRLLAPIEDYRALSVISGKSVRWLATKAIDPYKCTLEVDRRAPKIHNGIKIKTGLLRDWKFQWPFDVERVKERLEEELGGEEYVFYLRVDGKPLRSWPVTFDAEPKNPPTNRKQAVGPFGKEGDPLEKARKEEEKKAELLEARKRRMQIEREIEKENPEPDDGEGLEIPTDMITREEAEAIAADKLEKERLVNRMERMQIESDRKFEALMSELRSERNNGGSSEVLVQAINQSSQNMMEGLKLVVSNIGTQLTSVQQNSSSQFDNMLKLMQLSQESSNKTAAAQADGKARETDLLLQLVTQKSENQQLNADRQMELMRMGMEYAAQFGGGGGKGGDLDWANDAAGTLVKVITANLAKDKATEAAAGGQPGALPAPQEIDEAQVNAAAQEIAQRAVAKLRRQAQLRKDAIAAAAGEAPSGSAQQDAATVDNPPQTSPAQPAQPAGAAAAPAAPGAPAQPAGTQETAGGQGYAVFVAKMTGLLNHELAERPVESRFVSEVMGGPPEIRQRVAAVQSITDLMDIAAPHVNPELIGEIGSKLIDEKAQNWLTRSIVEIKEACGVSVEPQEGV